MSDNVFSVLKRVSPDGKFTQFYVDDGGFAYVLAEQDRGSYEARKAQWLELNPPAPAAPVEPNSEQTDGTTQPPQA